MCLLKPLLNRHPAIYQALKNRHVWYNETLEYIDARIAAGAAILIAPDKPLEISRVCHDPNVMQRIYDIGRKAGETANLRATDADGKINPAKLSALIFDQFQSGYDVIGAKVGQAWNAGNYVITGHNRKLA